MTSISATTAQNNPILSSAQNPSVRPSPTTDGDGDHGVEAAASNPITVTSAAAPGQPGAIINTTA